MTKPITPSRMSKSGRKPIAPPSDAAENIRALAADGWSVIGIAHRMGVDPKTFNRWLEQTPGLRDAFDLGREQERQVLHNIIYRKAVEKDDTTAAIMLLNSRHGYRSDTGGESGRVHVSIALPGAMTLQQFNTITEKAAPGAVALASRETDT
jgi:hypothetical protein